eukprot:c18518_g1_i1.p1 GENE.c18518_g1_i1~~c18518_g1_i1.p1  ORF type:complete len:216 (-),score=56.67 c18518_g1_i1:65-712(-)
MEAIRGLLGGQNSPLPSTEQGPANVASSIMSYFRKGASQTQPPQEQQLPPQTLVQKIRQSEFVKSVRPWTEFSSMSKFHKPKSSQEIISNARRNTIYFAANYVCIMCMLLVYSILTSPLLLLGLLACGGTWLYMTLVRKQPLVLGGKNVSEKHVVLGLCAFSVVVFLVTSGVEIVCWSLGFGAVLSLLHAGLRHPTLDASDVELQAIATGDIADI